MGSPTDIESLTLVFNALTVIPAGYSDCLAGSTVTVTDGNVTIPQEVIDIWGTDDSVIENYIVSQLNINNNEISLPEEPTLLPTEPTEIILEEESIPLGSDL